MGNIDISCSSACSDVSDCLSMNFIGLGGGGGGGTSHPQSFDLSYNDDEDPKVTVGEGYYMLGRAMHHITDPTSLGNKSALSGTKYVVLNVSWSSSGVTAKVEVVADLPRLTSASAYVLLYKLYKGDIQLDCRNTCTIPLYE